MRRDNIWPIFQKYVTKEFMIKHCLAVEIGMRAYAAKFDQDEDYWGAIGLLHDIDYEQYPQEHPLRSGECLAPNGFDDYFIETVISHGDQWDKERDLLQRTLVAVDCLAGFIVTCARKNPSASWEGLSLDFIKEKLDDESFASYTDRERIREFPKYIGMSLEEHIDFLMRAMQKAVLRPEYRLLVPNRS